MKENVWIVGASSGIGEAIAREYARAGASVLLSARRASELERVASSFASSSATVRCLPIDLEQPASIADGAAEAWTLLGGVDIVVLSAGISQRSMILETKLEVDRRLMEVNFFGQVAVTKALLPRMIECGRGHFVAISSLAGRVGTPMRSGYAASKHALHGFFDSLRAEVHDAGLKVTIVCPGYIRTEITRNSLVGDGSRYGRVDDALLHGMPVDECAREIVAGTQREREEFCVGRGKEMYAVPLKRFAPTVLSRIVRSHRVS
jgi:dehydrogenase/reductase SDR family member 7B